MQPSKTIATLATTVAIALALGACTTPREERSGAKPPQPAETPKPMPAPDNGYSTPAPPPIEDPAPPPTPDR